ncbi:MAG: metallophosphoesterase family protein [Nanoarchaeota archaeon]|nr:metallophosphoesterase family protein [Nanoarchaeota archaeon]MBU1027652.1 metallophosphoesterase family protein [Nanoarchaeota archaeon]
MIKKVFVASDIHDDIEALVKFTDYAQAQHADGMWVLGDFSLKPYTVEALEEVLESKDIGKFIEAKEKTNLEILAQMKGVLDNSGLEYRVIPGNYDPDILSVFGGRDLHKKTSMFGDAKIVGYGGADAFPQHIALLNQINEIVPFDHNELYTLLKKEKPQIVLTHNPPQQFCDDMFNGQNVGTPATTKYIMENNPKLVCGGHIHEAGPNGNNPSGVKSIAKYSNTIIVNPGNLGRFELLHFPSLETNMKFDYGTFSELHLDTDSSVKKIKNYSLKSPERKIGKIEKISEVVFP